LSQKKANPQKKNIQKSKSILDIKIFCYSAVVLAGIVFYAYTNSFNFIQDDSYITYRYVKNFTEGNGLVFNIGEKVEGYTCFLWIIFLSVIKSIGINYIKSSQILGIVSSLLAIFITFLVSYKIFPKNKGVLFNIVFTVMAVILLASNGSFAYWAVSGMETGLFACLVTLGIYLYLSEIKDKFSSFPLSSIAFLFASLTRPEGNLIFAVTLLHKLYLSYYFAKQEQQNVLKEIFSKNNLFWFGIYFIPALVYMIWRFSYYGYLLPNTFYAKTGTSMEYFLTGLDYLWNFLKSYGFYGLFVLIILFTLFSKENFKYYIYLFSIFIVYCLYIIFVGGDVLRPNRFFVPILPIYFILFQEGLAKLFEILEKNKQMTAAGFAGMVITIVFSYYVYNSEFETIKRYSELEKGLTEKMTLTGKWLNSKQQLAERQLTVAATTIGALSFYANVNLIDMLGLTDKEVAHNPKPIEEISSKEVGWRERNYNVDYVLSRKPDYIYFSTGMKPSAYAERGLFTSDEFIKYYYPYYFSLKEANFADVIYKRKTDEEVKNIQINEQNPNYDKSFVNLFNQAMNTQKDKTKLNEALNLYQQALDKGPSNWGLPYQMIGTIYLAQKNNNKAIESFEKAVEKDDFDVMSHYYLYQFYSEMQDTSKAFKHLEKIQKYSPEMLTK
jgi:tetratricopeptide (TPR) repeat protein